MRFAVVIFLGCIVGCSDKGPPVEFVVPNGFVGNVWLVKDDSSPELPLLDGKYVIGVPANGVLKVRSFRPFEKWHNETARFENGVVIPKKRAGSVHSPNQVTIEAGGMGRRTNNKRTLDVAHFVVAAEDSNLPYTGRIPGIDDQLEH